MLSKISFVFLKATVAHGPSIGKIQSRCLLNSNVSITIPPNAYSKLIFTLLQTSALHRAVLSILDICLRFSDFFVEFAGDVTHDVSKASIHIRRHRSRHQRRQRKNVIGFSQSIKYDSSSEDDDDSSDEDNLTANDEPSFFMSSMISNVKGDDELPSTDRLDTMSSELDSLVRFIRRGVETLAGGTGEAAPAFGVLAFALEDWDL
jgi:gamma-tubulin complex component 5